MQQRVSHVRGSSAEGALTARPLDSAAEANYSNYIKAIELKITPIGNSKGVRVPAATLRRYGIGASVVMEERSEGIMLRPAELSAAKLSREDTTREMAVSGEDWSGLDTAVADGLESQPWDTGKSPRVAERKAGYKADRQQEVMK